LKQQLMHRTSEILKPIYKLCQVKESQIIPLLQKDMKHAKYLIKRMGSISLGNDYVPWKVQSNGSKRIIELPMMLFGEKWLDINTDPDTPSLIVDDIRDLSGVHCSIFQRVNQDGDMINICTNKLSPKRQRAVGKLINHLNQDGSPNQIIAEILAGKQYLKKTYFENSWVTLMCEPIYCSVTKKIIGCLYVSISQKATVEASIRKIILETAIGKSGYMWVIGSKEDRRGLYIISKDGMRDGEYVLDVQDYEGNFFVKTIITKALQTSRGQTNYIHYPWKNPGEDRPREKISAFTYFEPWDWIIGSSAYEDDFQEPQLRVNSTFQNMFFLTLLTGIALFLCSILAAFFVNRTIRTFSEERELQNWLKTSLNELKDKMQGEQRVDRLISAILNYLSKSIHAHIGVIYLRQESEFFTPMATYGISDGDLKIQPVKFGSGLVGQAAENKESLFLKKIPVSKLKNSVVLSDSYTKSMIIKPLIHEKEVIGIIQMAFQLRFSNIHCEFINKAAETIAIAIYTAQSRTRVNDLLEKTQKQAQDLERVSKYKSDFLANMSHEIRTPMNAIIGLSYLMLKTQLSPQQLDYQKKMQISAKSLLQLIDDILDFSKIEAGKLNIEIREFVINEVVESISSVIMFKSLEKGLDFKIKVSESVPKHLFGDSFRLGQILINLASNAVKFTEEGEVCVTISLEKESSPKVILRFTVQDTGIGMSQEQINHLYTSFYQADASFSRKYGGSGLGLAISKRLIEMMGGEIHVVSQPGVGSKFTFTICFKKAENKGTATVDGINIDQASKLLSGYHFLLVEDNDINRQVARELLKQIGMKISIAENGQKAVDLAISNKFDGILMDLQMPVLDGLSATQAIRSHPHIKKIPIIAMTANVMAGDIKRCRKVGMDDYIKKPINPSVMYETIYRNLKKYTQHICALSDNTDNFKQKLNNNIEQDAVVLPESLDGVDLNKGLFNMNNDKKLYLKILKNVYNRFKDITQKIQIELDKKDYVVAQRLAHTIKGVSGTMGANDLFQRSFDLELAIKDKVLDNISTLMDSFSLELNRVMSGLSQFIDNDDEVAHDGEGKNNTLLSEPQNRTLIKEKLNELSELIDEGNSEALSKIDELKKNLSQSCLVGDIDNLASQVDDYEFEEARETFNKILEKLNSMTIF
ncbi:multi-sensor hybrid histidine kinase, partial [Candidatus Magnetomorum sp. HK-1]